MLHVNLTQRLFNHAIGIAIGVLLGFLLFTLPSCGGAKETKIEGSSVQQRDTLQKKDEGRKATKTRRVMVSPATQKADAQASTQPTVLVLNGERIEAPPGMAVEYESSDDNATDPATINRDRVAAAKGASLSTPSKDGTGNFKADAPMVSLSGITDDGTGGGGGKSDGGDTSTSWKFEMPAMSGWMAKSLFWISIGFVAAGVLILCAPTLVTRFALSSQAAPACFLAAGACFLASFTVDRYPWVLLVCILAVLGVFGWYVYHRYVANKLAKTDAALSKVVEGVEAAPADAQAAVKQSISDVGGSDSAIKTVISEKKEALQ